MVSFKNYELSFSLRSQKCKVLSLYIFGMISFRPLHVWTSNPANRTQTSRLKLDTSCHIVPLIFKFMYINYIESGQPNSTFFFETCHFEDPGIDGAQTAQQLNAIFTKNISEWRDFEENLCVFPHNSHAKKKKKKKRRKCFDAQSREYYSRLHPGAAKAYQHSLRVL